jgi:hypothetical protein
VSRVPEAAAAAVIRDLDGTGHRLDSLWRDHVVVVAFLRHFG